MSPLLMTLRFGTDPPSSTSVTRAWPFPMASASVTYHGPPSVFANNG